MQVVSVVGARPQFVKLAPVAAALADPTSSPGVEHVIVHTGQHYDAAMSDSFFAELRIPEPDVHLGVGVAGHTGHGAQTGAMLAALDPVLEKYRPDWVLVYGDTNSTLAGALSAVKLHLPVAHLEAGLRSFNRAMPEEHNRVLTDHAADLLLAPTQVAMNHLSAEGLAGRARLVGDVMTDVCYAVRDVVADREIMLPQGVDGDAPYVLATIHRAENTDDPDRLAAVAAALATVDVAVVLLAHPRLRARAERFGVQLAGRSADGVHVGDPLPYPQLVRALLGSAGVITDSGGLQKEAYLLGVPCTTLRSETEWTETLDGGWNVLDPDLSLVARTAARPAPSGERASPYGDGRAAHRVAEALRAADHGAATRR